MLSHAHLQRAFTLVEVLVVVAIIAIAGAIVVPSINNAGSLNVQAASRLVIADLLYAQNDAVAQQKSRKVVFEPASNRYRLTALDGTTLGVNWKSGVAATGNYVVDFGNDDRFRGIVLENINFGDDNQIIFDPLGGPDTGGSVEVVFGPNRYRIVVAAITGRITVAPVDGG